MPIPISIILTDRGANGAPTTSNPVNLAGRVESYEDALSDRYGFETARVAWTPTWAEIEEWARYDHLMRPMVAYSPDARQIWRGVLAEIEISIGTKKIAFSLKDMANRLTVRFSEPGGAQGDSTVYSSAASQALFGIKDRVINASIALSAAASNQAQTILNYIAFPRSKQSSAAGTTRGDLSITLTFWGKYALLDWLLTASTSTTSTASSTQIASLLTSYTATNAFFSSSAANIVATGVSDTEYIEPDTTYREKIERLLARGNSAQQPLAWGFYDDDVFVVTPRASATPATITYYESEASGQIRDQWQNVLDVWDVRPNAMAQIVDLIDAPTPGSVETPFRKYVARVTRSVRGEDVTVTLEPDDTESLEDLLTSPAGAGPAGTSERQAAFERKVTAPARSVFANTDNNTRFDRAIGVWKPAAGGTGKVNTGTLDVPSNGTVDLGGGSISNTGGGAVDVGTGAGIGSSGSLSETIDDRVAALLTAGSNITLTYNDGANTLTIAAASSGGTVGGTGTAGRLTQWATGGADLQDSTLIKSGTGVLTLSAAAAATLTIDSTTRLDGAGAAANQVLQWNGTAYAPSSLVSTDISNWNEAVDDRVAALLTAGSNITLTYNDGANTLTIAAASSGGTVGGTGTAGRLTQWATGGANIENSTLIKSGAGVLTISAGSTATFTIDSSTRLDGSGATSGQVLAYNGTAYAPTTLAAADVSAAPDNAKYIVQQATSALSAEQALGALATGLLKNTTTTGVLSIATAGTDYAAASHTHTSTDITNFNEAVDDRVDALLVAGTGITLTYNDAGNSLTIASSGVTASGGANKNVAYFTGTNTLGSSTGLQFDTTNSTLTVRDQMLVAGSGAGYFMDERDGSGQWVMYATGSAWRVNDGGAGDPLAVTTSNQLLIDGTQVLTTRRTGWAAASGTATRSTFNTATVTLQVLAEHVKAMIDDNMTHGFYGT